ncbi:MAG: AAA family ATPase, partial [Stackebrandtia sp.]
IAEVRDLDPRRRPAPTPAQARGAVDLAAPTASGVVLDDRDEAYARAALDAECGRVAAANDGQRNDTLNAAAFSLGQLVASGVLDERLVVDALTAAAGTAGLDVDANCGPRGIAKTVASGLAAGVRHPRRPDPSPNGEGHAHAAPEVADSGVEASSSLSAQLRAALVDTHGLDAVPRPAPVVDDILYADSTAWLIGPPGNGKSFVALDVAGCVATGQPWQGRPVKPGPVVYLVAEGLWGVRDRVRAWEAANNRAMTGVQFLPVAVQASQPAPWAALVELVADLAPALVVLDTQARITVGAEENSAKDMGIFVEAVERLRKAGGCCVLTVHHTGRSGTLRGSTALEGAATTIIATAKEDDLVTMECHKQKDAPPFEPVELRLTPHAGSAVLTPALGEAHAWRLTPAVAKALETWWAAFEDEDVSATTLVDSGVIAKATFHNNRKALVKRGILAANGTEKTRRYRLLCRPTAAVLDGLR